MSAASNSGRGFAYLGALLGGGVSIAANIAHSFVPPAGVPAVTWRPQLGAVVGAVFWPVGLFIAVEILARVAWPAGRRWLLVRLGGLLPVALVAAVVSYRHLSGLLAWYHEDTLTATIGPLAVDGLMVMATGALIATGARRLAAAPVRPVPMLTVPAGSGPVESGPAGIGAAVAVGGLDQGDADPAPAARSAARGFVPVPLGAFSRVNGSEAS